MTTAVVPVTGFEDNGFDSDWESGDSCAKLYERSRIRALADERETVQKKTFCKWVNSHLGRVSCNIEDLYLDLRDGKMLIKLLEILSGENLPRPTRGKMRIHCLENVDKALNFLYEQRVHMENMGAHDIVDGSSRLTLGLIWTIILRFQIQDITVKEFDNSEVMQAKDALLLWCQMKTAGYPNVNVRNFTTSWRDGLAFNALIHKHRPDLIDYATLTRAAPVDNLSHAFEVAEKRLNLVSLLDPEDVIVETPDERSIVTYVVSYYHYFSQMKADNVHSKRIGRVLNQAMETSSMINHYDQLTNDLLAWIEQTQDLLNDRAFANSLSGVQQQLAAFNTYRTVEKPPKFTEKGNLEVLLFTIQSKMRANNQRPFLPEEGKLITDINRAWDTLEKAEHARELALRDELIRQEKLEQLAARFDRKAGMREAWLSENQRLVGQDNFGDDLASVEAAAKKHEAIETDIISYEERVNAVVTVATELQVENYHDLPRVLARKDNVLRLWETLLGLLKGRRARLECSTRLRQSLEEVDYLRDWIEEIGGRLSSEDCGKHLMGVEDLLQKHQLMESDIKMLADRMEQVLAQTQVFITRENFPADVGPDYYPTDPAEVEKRGKELREAYANLVELSKKRKRRLQDSRLLWQFMWEMGDHEAWIKERSQLMLSPDLGHDMMSVHRLMSKHEALDTEVRNRRPVLDEAITKGKELMRGGNMGAGTIRDRISQMQDLWAEMEGFSRDRLAHLNKSAEFFQAMSDADDVDAWMTEMSRLLATQDLGNTEATVKALIRQHAKVQAEILENKSSVEDLRTALNKFQPGDLNRDRLEQRVEATEKRYSELLDKANTREIALKDAMSMYRVFSETENVRIWITEKEKLLTTLVPGEEIEELEVVRHRFAGFETEMTNNADKVATVNDLVERLATIKHPQADLIMQQQDNLNKSWNSLADLVEGRRAQLADEYKYNQFQMECKQAGEWIREKGRLIESTDELGDDLAGIVQLQRKIGNLQRDMDAIKTKVEHLDATADELIVKRPEEAPELKALRDQLDGQWQELQDMLKDRHDRLTESSELQVFLQDLDHIHMWLSRMQTTVASEDVPKDLSEAEKSLAAHEQHKEEINSCEAEFFRLLGYGRRITQDETDAQYMFLSQRLNALEDGWKDLREMWENRQMHLSQSLSLQIFLRDALQADILLSQQDNVLTKEDAIASLEAAQKALRDHENFLGIMTANDERVNAVIEFGHKLLEREHYAAEKIKQKVDNIGHRRNLNRRKSNERLEALQNHVLVRELSQDVDDIEEWIQEKMLVAQDMTYKGNKDINSLYNKHRAFEDEIEANKERFDRVQKDGEEMVRERPVLGEHVTPRLADLKHQWNELESTTKDKGEKMIEANRAVIFQEGTSNVMTWLETIGEQIVVTEEEVETLTDVNVKLKKVDDTDKEIEIKKRQIQDLKSHAERLKMEQPEKAKEIEEKHAIIEQRFTQLLAPMTTRRDQLTGKKRIHQFFRDVEDEKLWIEDKMPLAGSPTVGTSLLTSQQLIRRHKHLEKEVENHTPRIEAVAQDGEALLRESHPQSNLITQKLEELHDSWDKLSGAIGDRRNRLESSERAQSYLLDASEAEAWMGEQELYLMSEERARDDQGALNALKRHENRERAIHNYGEEIKSLGERSRQLNVSPHVDSEAIAQKQARIDKLYAGLRDLCEEKKSRLGELQNLNQLYNEIWDLEAWIAERTLVASSHDVGVDLEHCCLLRERFREFAHDTEIQGSDRVEAANASCDVLILAGHTDSGEAAAWKDQINEAWADLLEFIDTRAQLLKSAWDCHKYMSDCQDVLDRISEKSTCMPSEISKDAKSVAVQQRKHTAFEHDINTLGTQVQWIVDTANILLPLYSGPKESQICDKRDEVVTAWNRLQMAAEERKHHLSDAIDSHRFFAMCRELRLWIETVCRDMTDKEKPRDVSGVELLMNSHRSVKAEMDAREENVSICLNLGRTLLHRSHPQAEEVRQCLILLVTERFWLEEQWKLKWEHLQLMLEVYQFARDAAVAESWLIAQTPYLANQDLGENLDETLILLKKHLAFERAAATQSERFQALSKLTTFEVRESERTQEAQARKLEDQETRLELLLREFRQPLTPPQKPSRASRDSPRSAQARDSGPSSPGSPTEPTSTGEMREREGGASHKEGPLSRKHEWESRGKKASNRSWHELHVVLDPSRGLLLVFKDARLSRERPQETYHREAGLSLSSITAAPASDYTKRANVFRLKVTTTGAEFLFMARSNSEMREWIETINACTPSTSASGGKASTLPLHSSPTDEPEQAPSGGKRKFFTLGRKK